MPYFLEWCSIRLENITIKKQNFEIKIMNKIMKQKKYKVMHAATASVEKYLLKVCQKFVINRSNSASKYQ